MILSTSTDLYHHSDYSFVCSIFDGRSCDQHSAVTLVEEHSTYATSSLESQIKNSYSFFLSACTANCKSCATNEGEKCDTGQCNIGYQLNPTTLACDGKLIANSAVSQSSVIDIDKAVKLTHFVNVMLTCNVKWMVLGRRR